LQPYWGGEPTPQCPPPSQNSSFQSQSLYAAVILKSAIGRYHARQGARYGEYGRAVRSREALVMTDGPGVRSGEWGLGGGKPPPQIIAINLFVPTQHPIFTPGPDNRWCNCYNSAWKLSLVLASNKDQK